MEINRAPARVLGFRFAGTSAGLKSVAGARDMGLILSDLPAAAASVFTSNRIKAAPVLVAQERVARGRLRAVIVNSGSANCFTARAGLRLARESCAATAREIGCDPSMVAPCSTGVIGRLYDFDKYRRGVRELVASLAEDGLEDFARAIMTTDTRPKMASVELMLSGARVTIAGTAKGAGMIAPRMATMLAFIVTDAALSPAFLRSVLRRSVAESFNAITVDGDMSTNDTVIAMSSGAAGNPPFSAREQSQFNHAFSALARSLADQLVYDGEGATKLVQVEVRGARSDGEAERIARRIANSPLVKTAFFGCDPNVGRVLMAAGASGAALDPDRLKLTVGGVTVAARGALVSEALERAATQMREREFKVQLDLRLGRGRAVILTTDLSLDYVRINAEYTT